MSVEIVGDGSPASSSVEAPAERLGRGAVVREDVRVAHHVREGVAELLDLAATRRSPARRRRSRRRRARAARPAGSAVTERPMKRPATCAGMMLAATPPSTTMPWTWSPGRSCWRSRPMATWAIVMASSALTPSHGAAEACASRPVKMTSKWSTARQRVSSRSLGPGVDHHRGVHAVEVAGVDQVDLAAAALLRGRAQQHDGEVELVGDRGQPDGGAERRRGDDVVAAGVADVGQRVVLRAQRDVQRPRPGRRPKGGRQPGDAALDGEARRPRPRRRPRSALWTSS